jgi:hypothetical protein
MLTFKNSKGKKSVNLKAPSLESTTSIPVMEYVYNYDEYRQSVLTNNERTADPSKHEQIKSFLDKIRGDVKMTLLKDTLPTNFSSLQELYPASRKFYIPPGQL